MPRTCTICTHAQRREIDGALVAGRETFRTIADRWSVSKTALIRHRTDHLPATLVKAHEAEEVARADNLLDQVRHLADEAREILADVKTTKPGTAVQAIRAVAQVLELQAKILGQIRSETQVNVGIVLGSPEWGRVAAAVMGALLPYPDARAAVGDALAGLARGPETEAVVAQGGTRERF